MNDKLHAHVTRVGFDLSLGKTHVEALVWASEILDKPGYRRSPRMFVSATHGLIDRGLMLHHYDKEVADRIPSEQRPLSTFYTITDAGWLAIGLLRESGLYDEYLTRMEYDGVVLV